MKRRSGLVSNSSSSSYICDCCGYEACGTDMCLCDFDMTSCENGHYYCVEHQLKITESAARMLTQKAVDEGWLEHEAEEEAREELGKDSFDIAWFEAYEGEILGDDEKPKELCPVCSLDYVTDKMLIPHLLGFVNKEREEVEDEIRKTYKDFDDMKEKLSRKK